MTMNRVAEALINHGAVEYGSFVLASGATSTYYLDVKSAITDPELLGLIGNEIAARFPADMVAGVAVGGIPLAVAVSLAGKIPYAIIRNQEKTHGKGGRLIGRVSGKEVLLVEDVTTSGGSALYGVQALRAAGASVSRVVTVVDREQGATLLLSGDHVELHALVRAGDIIRE